MVYVGKGWTFTCSLQHLQWGMDDNTISHDYSLEYRDRPWSYWHVCCSQFLTDNFLKIVSLSITCYAVGFFFKLKFVSGRVLIDMMQKRFFHLWCINHIILVTTKKSHWLQKDCLCSSEQSLVQYLEELIWECHMCWNLKYEW